MTLIIFSFGLAIFLLAMHQLESGIRLASGQGLNNWIVGKTNTPLSSASCGVVITAILQSSSMVSLIALAFVSAGIMPLFNGIGVVLGANLGTTITGWVVTIIGFKMNLQTLVVPLLGLGAAFNLGYVKNERVAGAGKAIFAFGLLILGLDVMKDSVTGFTDVLDIGALKSMPSWVYLLSGVVLAAVMQSSSAVMIVTLSLLNSDLLVLTDAAALVIGADLGTTSTTVLGSFGQSGVKKQLAFAHVFFNVAVNSIAFLVLLPLLPRLLEYSGIQDTMFGLVTFHSLFNLAGLIVFLPILKLYTRWIQTLIPLREDVRHEFFKVPVEVPEAAVNSLKMALRYLGSDAIQLNYLELGLDPKLINANIEYPTSPRGDFETQYQNLKEFEGGFVHYANKLHLTLSDKLKGAEITRMLEAVRALVYASKTLKDIKVDFKHLNQSAANSLGSQLASAHRQFLLEFYEVFIPLLLADVETEYASEQSDTLSELNGKHHQHCSDMILQHMRRGSETPLHISTWFNLNHELHHYVRYMLSALQNLRSVRLD